MKVLQFVADALGDASYLLIDGPLAVAVDPQRDVRPYLAAAREHGAEITHVFETHVHNDYLSGGLELAARGARIVAPARSGLLFPHNELADGDELAFGHTTIRAVAAPGHTYEHTAYLAVDPAGVPQAAFTGGALLVASAGRTDLLGPDHTEDLTRMQWESARRLDALLPATADVLPTHGAGSFCSAAGVTSERRSSVAVERNRNPLLALPAFEAFRAGHLADPQPIPAYYRHMAPINQEGPRVYLEPPVPATLAREPLERLTREGVIPVDLRRRSEFVAGHIPGSIGIEESSASLAYISWTTPFNAPLALVVADQAQALRATVDLFRIGYEDIRGYTTFDDWARAGGAVETSDILDADGVGRLLRNGGEVLDVRFEYEQEAEPVPGAKRMPIDRIETWAAGLAGRRVAVFCESGMRATLATSVLRRQGVDASVLPRGGAGEVIEALQRAGGSRA